jgi:broad specificity phosphatase PhoE
MKIFLCRHGQTTGDIEDRYGGDYEDQLTIAGRDQARQLANELTDKNIEIIFTSPRIRARETADILKSVLNTEVRVIENLRERNHYGILSGMVKAEAQKKYPEETEKVKNYKTCASGGEDYNSLLERIKPVLSEIFNSGFKTVVAVTHGGVIRAIFRDLLHLGEIKLGDCACAELEFDGNQIKIIKLNGISY